MNEKTAIEYLTEDAEEKSLSEIGEAVDTLYRVYGTYKNITQQLNLNVSDKFLGSRHRIFLLPYGIRKRVDSGHISISQAYQISRIKNEDDQWLFAVIIVEKKLRVDECERVANFVVQQNWTMRDALSTVAGVSLEEIIPPVLLLPIGADFWFALSKMAWEHDKEWQDLCYEIIRRGIAVDVEEMANQIEILATSLKKAGRASIDDCVC